MTKIEKNLKLAATHLIMGNTYAACATVAAIHRAGSAQDRDAAVAWIVANGLLSQVDIINGCMVAAS